MTPLNDWQPELFQEFQAPTKPPWWARYWSTSQRFLVLRLAHEDLILSAIGAIMVVVLGFCVGVERGKHLVVASVSPRAISAPVAPAVVLPPVAPAPAMPTLPTAPSTPQRVVTPTRSGPTKVVSASPAIDSRYVVQIASFTTRSDAAAAHARLSQRGVRAVLATKGKYHVLYASGFATYAQATAAADRLRPTYRDCFVRKQLAERG